MAKSRKKLSQLTFEKVATLLVEALEEAPNLAITITSYHRQGLPTNSSSLSSRYN